MTEIETDMLVVKPKGELGPAPTGEQQRRSHPVW